MKPDDIGPVLRRTLPPTPADEQAQLFARIQEQVAARDAALFKELAQQAARRRIKVGVGAVVVVIVLTLAALWSLRPDKDEPEPPVPPDRPQGVESPPDGPPLHAGEETEEKRP